MGGDKQSTFKGGGGTFRQYDFHGYQPDKEIIPGINERKRLELADALSRIGIFQLAEPPNAVEYQRARSSPYGTEEISF